MPVEIYANDTWQLIILQKSKKYFLLFCGIFKTYAFDPSQLLVSDHYKYFWC